MYVFFLIFLLLLGFTTKPEVRITGQTFWGKSAEIKIENKEPVDLSEVYVKLIRFCWTKSTWNSVDGLTSITSNNFFSKGLIEANRIVSRQPIFVKVAQGGGINVTEFLKDKHCGYMQLSEKYKNVSNYEYELVFENSG